MLHRAATAGADASVVHDLYSSAYGCLMFLVEVEAAPTPKIFEHVDPARKHELRLPTPVFIDETLQALQSLHFSYLPSLPPPPTSAKTFSCSWILFYVLVYCSAFLCDACRVSRVACRVCAITLLLLLLWFVKRSSPRP